MREQDMMASNHGQFFIAYAWSMDAVSIAEVGRTPGFVLCKPPINAVTKATCYHLGIFGESVSVTTTNPSPPILAGHRKIPVIECCGWTNASSEQSIYQAVVKIQAAFM